ncbi:MAG TPA: PIN domain nuclease [Terriglobia bacterium]
MPAIVDTTVWIDFFRDSKSEQTDLLERIIRRGEAALGDVILSEVLQGIDSDKEFRSVKRHFSNFPIYLMIGRRNAIQSAANYRKLRSKGITVRKTVDCWIATFCIERGFPLLHNDRDFDPFEEHLELRVLRQFPYSVG